MLDDVIFLIGAGASWAAPANLPLFSEIQEAIARALRLDSSLLSRLAPEAAMMLLDRFKVPVERDLISALDSRQPNLVHHVLAEAIERGAVVWTPNVDILIEVAAGWSGPLLLQRVAAWSPESDPPENIDSARLLKPHGSITAPPLKLRSDQVLVPLEGRWRERLLRDFGDKGRSVLVYGYAGRDPDLRPILQEGFVSSGPVTWFEPKAEVRDEIAEVYGPYCRQGLTLLPVEPGELPHIEFVRWAEQKGLAARIPSRVKAPFEGGERQEPALRFEYGKRPLVRAQLLSSIGSAREARRAFNGAIVRAAITPKLDELMAGIRARARFAYWHDELKVRWLGWILGSSLARRVSAIREHAYNRHVVVLMNRGRLEESARLAREAVEVRGLLRDRLNRVATRRWLTSMTEAESESRAVLSDARREMERSRFGHREVQTTAQAAFEVALSVYWRGHISASREALLELRGLGPHVSARWIAWSEWLGACHAMSMWEPEPPSRLLTSAAEVFTLEGPAQRPALDSIRLSQLALDRLLLALGRSPKAAADEWMADHHGLRLGRMPSAVRAGLTFELAERARLDAKPSLARQYYSRLVPSAIPFYRGLGMLGLAELDREAGQSGPWADRAQGIGRRYSLGWIDAHATLSLWLGGALSDAAAVDEVESSGAQLPRYPDVDSPARWLISGIRIRRPLLAVV